jgi:hypothetical protein
MPLTKERREMEFTASSLNVDEAWHHLQRLAKKDVKATTARCSTPARE